MKRSFPIVVVVVVAFVAPNVTGHYHRIMVFSIIVKCCYASDTVCTNASKAFDSPIQGLSSALMLLCENAYCVAEFGSS